MPLFGRAEPGLARLEVVLGLPQPLEGVVVALLLRHLDLDQGEGIGFAEVLEERDGLLLLLGPLGI
eukprot:11621676-Alexandrium_andersonii.AAC.1